MTTYKTRSKEFGPLTFTVTAATEIDPSDVWLEGNNYAHDWNAKRLIDAWRVQIGEGGDFTMRGGDTLKASATNLKRVAQKWLRDRRTWQRRLGTWQ